MSERSTCVCVCVCVFEASVLEDISITLLASAIQFMKWKGDLL